MPTAREVIAQATAEITQYLDKCTDVREPTADDEKYGRSNIRVAKPQYEGQRLTQAKITLMQGLAGILQEMAAKPLLTSDNEIYQNLRDRLNQLLDAPSGIMNAEQEQTNRQILTIQQTTGGRLLNALFGRRTDTKAIVDFLESNMAQALDPEVVPRQ